MFGAAAVRTWTGVAQEAMSLPELRREMASLMLANGEGV